MFSVLSVTIRQGFSWMHAKNGTTLDPVGNTELSEVSSLPLGSLYSLGVGGRLHEPLQKYVMRRQQGQGWCF